MNLAGSECVSLGILTEKRVMGTFKCGKVILECFYVSVSVCLLCSVLVPEWLTEFVKILFVFVFSSSLGAL